MGRISTIRRKTTETDLELFFDIDGKGSTKQSSIDTGIGFFDHMLALLAKHGHFIMDVKVKGDIHVDCHHTVEDTGIALGCAIREALGDKKGISRYGHSITPMDESLAMVAMDLGGRPYFAMDARFAGEKAGEMDTQLVEEFFRAVSMNGFLNLHIKVFYGSNDHHIIEAIFKAFARALSQAATIDPDVDGVMSTKGII